MPPCLSTPACVECGPLFNRDPDFPIRPVGLSGQHLKSSKGRVLYCEDDLDSRELIRFVITRGGYEVVCAETGVEALQIARLEQFDLFLVDNRMPHLSGVELAQHIREFDQITPILFCSGAAHESDRQAALTAGAQGYLTKPLDIDLLLDEVARLIRESS